MCIYFDSEDTLVYVGAIDDNANSATDVEEFYIKDAIEQLSAGQDITQPPQNPSVVLLKG